MKLFTALILGTALLAFGVALFNTPSLVAQSANDAVFNCENVDTDFCDSVDSESTRGDRILGPNGIITQITQVVIFLTGAISVIMVIIGGFRYTLSGGDSNATKGAKDTIMYAVIGLVVVIFSQVIVTFVLSRL